MEADLKNLVELLPGGFDSLLPLFEGRDVLDVGVAAHNIQRYRAADWKHRKIAKVARKCVGIDIVKEMCDLLNEDAYDALCIDVTSDVTLPEWFDYVFVGDVIEHITNPEKALRFAYRHLRGAGKVIVGTPNPFYLPYFLNSPLTKSALDASGLV